MATYDWTILTLERDLLPAEMEGGVTIAHWRCLASQDTDADIETETEAEADTTSTYGTEGFTPDPEASDYIAYDDLTEAEVLAWCWAANVDKDAIEARLQDELDAIATPVTAAGVPW